MFGHLSLYRVYNIMWAYSNKALADTMHSQSVYTLIMDQ